MKVTKYFVYLDGYGSYDSWFDDETDAIVYAQKNGNNDTRIDKCELDISDDGFSYEVLSTESVEFDHNIPNEEDTINVPEVDDLDDFDVDFPDSDINDYNISDDPDFDMWDEDPTPADWDDPNRFTKHEDLNIKEAVKRLEENEDTVECKHCFDLFPKADCVKTDDGYICKKCDQEMHSHQGTNLDLIDADPFDLNYDDPRDEEEEPEKEVKSEPFDADENRKHEEGIQEAAEELQDVNYVDYKHSYCHILQPNLKKLNAIVHYYKEPLSTVKGFIFNLLKDPQIRWTKKEREFADNIRAMDNSEDIYNYVVNSIEKAKTIIVKVKPNGELASMQDADLEEAAPVEFSEEELKLDEKLYSYLTDPSGFEGEVEAANEDEAFRKAETEVAQKGAYVADELIDIKEVEESLEESANEFVPVNYHDDWETPDALGFYHILIKKDLVDQWTEFDKTLPMKFKTWYDLTNSKIEDGSLSEGDLVEFVLAQCFEPYIQNKFGKDNIKVDWNCETGCNEPLEEHINDRPADIESDQENHGVDNAIVDCKKYTLVAHSEDEKPVDCKIEKPALEEPVAGEPIDAELYEDFDSYNKMMAEIKSKDSWKMSEIKELEKKYGVEIKSAELNKIPNLVKDLEEAKKDDELPVDPEAAKLEVHTMLNDLVADEIEAINGYEEAKKEILDTPIAHKDNILDTIDHVEDEEKEHVDELIAATTEIPFDKEEAPAPVVEEPAPVVEEKPVVEEGYQDPFDQEFPKNEGKALEEVAARIPFDSEVSIGDRIRIIHLAGESTEYDGREGEVSHIDSLGQLHGTWGGLAVIPGMDDYEIIVDENLTEDILTEATKSQIIDNVYSSGKYIVLKRISGEDWEIADNQQFDKINDAIAFAKTQSNNKNVDAVRKGKTVTTKVCTKDKAKTFIVYENGKAKANSIDLFIKDIKADNKLNKLKGKGTNIADDESEETAAPKEESEEEQDKKFLHALERGDKTPKDLNPGQLKYYIKVAKTVGGYDDTIADLEAELKSREPKPEPTPAPEKSEEEKEQEEYIKRVKQDLRAMANGDKDLNPEDFKNKHKLNNYIKIAETNSDFKDILADLKALKPETPAEETPVEEEPKEEPQPEGEAKPVENKGQKLKRLGKENQQIADALAAAGFNTDDLYVTNKNGKKTKATKKLNALRKALFGESYDVTDALYEDLPVELEEETIYGLYINKEEKPAEVGSHTEMTAKKKHLEDTSPDNKYVVKKIGNSSWESLKEGVEYNKFSPEEQAELGCDEDGYYDRGRYVFDGWCGDIFDEADCRYEADFGWLCPQCQAALKSRGEQLTFIEELKESLSDDKLRSLFEDHLYQGGYIEDRKTDIFFDYDNIDLDTWINDLVDFFVKGLGDYYGFTAEEMKKAIYADSAFLDDLRAEFDELKEEYGDFNEEDTLDGFVKNIDDEPVQPKPAETETDQSIDDVIASWGDNSTQNESLEEAFGNLSEENLQKLEAALNELCSEKAKLEYDGWDGNPYNNYFVDGAITDWEIPDGESVMTIWTSTPWLSATVDVSKIDFSKDIADIKKQIMYWYDPEIDENYSPDRDEY